MMKTKGTAALLALFLGGIGIHRFYLNRPISGVFYLVFCWTFIPSIFALVEVFYYCLCSQTSFDNEFNKESMSRMTANSNGTQSATEELSVLGGLYEKNLLTREEFEIKKAQLLKKIG